MSGFFQIRSAEQIERDEEAFAVAEPRLPVQIEEDRANEMLIQSEETDPEAARVLALARLLRPDAWESRASFLEMAERERAGSRANSPVGRRLVATYGRCASGGVAQSIRLAREVIAMVRSWG